MEFPRRRERSSSCPEIGNPEIYCFSPCLSVPDAGLRSTKWNKCHGGVSAASSETKLLQSLQRDKDSEGYRPQINWQSPALDVRWVGFRPRLIDFEDECDFELAGTPTRRNIASRRSPWLSFPDQSPTRANSISSSIPSNDDDGDDDNDDTFELQHTTQSREAERQSGKLYPSPTQIGLRMFTGKKGVDAIFRPRITRNTSKPTVPARQSSNPTESTAASGEYTHVSPGKKFKTSPQQTRSEAEKPRVHNTWQAAKATVHKQNFPAKFRNICEWGRNNNSAVLLILLSWFTMFILAQTRILRIDTWEFLNPELKRKNQKVYPSTDSDWRPDPMSIVNLLFSKNSSQTILDARIIYHLESIEERQGRLHDKVQRQLNGNAIVLDFMLQEMQNLKSAFSAVADRRQMERQIDKLKGDIKRCNEDMLSRTTRKPIIIKQRPTYTVTKMTKTIIRQHYRTSRPRPTVYNKVLFYPNDSIKQQKTNQPGRLDATSPILTDKDVDRIAQKLAKSVNISSKDINPGGPWWNVFPSFSGVGKGTERLLTKRLELIIQLLCLEESGLLADSFASRIRKCLKSRRELVSILHFRTQSTIPNRILSTTAKFSDDLPPAGFSIVCGAVILFYGSTFARWVGWYHGGVGRKRILRILAICMSVLSVIIWPTRLAALWIRHQEQFEPIRRLPWGARLLAEIRIYLVAALEKIPTWLPDSIQAGWESLDLIGRRKLRSGVYVNHGSKIQLFLQKAGSFGRYISIWSIKNIAWISVPYMVLECSVLLVIFAFVTRGLPAIRIGVEKIRHWTSRFQGNTLTVIKQVPDFWQSNRAFFTRGWILGLTQLLHILLKQFIISIRDSRSFQWAKEVAQQWVRKIGGACISFIRLFQKRNIAPTKILEVAQTYASKIWGTIRSLVSTIWKSLLCRSRLLGNKSWALLQAPFFNARKWSLQGAGPGFLRAVKKACGYISQWTFYMIWIVRESGAQVLERVRGSNALAAWNVKSHHSSARALRFLEIVWRWAWGVILAVQEHLRNIIQRWLWGRY